MLIGRVALHVDGSKTMTTPEDDSNDEPQYSSSAQCITLRMIGQEFEPEYTHQCFDGEWIRGYQPYIIRGSHKSHANHAVASHEVQATVTLSPSCESCHVELSIRRKRKQKAARAIESRPKRRKLDTVEENSAFEDSNDEQEEDGVDSIDSSDDEEDNDEEEEYREESTAKGSETEDDHSDAGTTRHRRMHPDEILERLGRALPKLYTDNKNVIEDDHLRKPIGKVVKTYTRPSNNEGAPEEFTLTIADSEAADYHKQVQNLALFFIESADGVSLKQNNAGGHWKAMYLFQKRGTRRYALCGYLTLFHFSSPFRKPKPGTIVRICQALLLPPYQRRGHGKAMIRAVHDMAQESDDIVEINVEDPAPGFIALRNRIDFELLVESLETDQPWLPPKYLNQNDFPTLVDKDITPAATMGRLTTKQVQIAYELYKLRDLPTDDVHLEKQYRLMVKKRLLKLHREQLSVCKTKEERQILLAEIWREVFRKYKAILKRP